MLLGPYEIESRLGAGGMGEVYKTATHAFSPQTGTGRIPVPGLVEETACSGCSLAMSFRANIRVPDDLAGAWRGQFER
jgi:hypothetical protein